MLGQAGTLALIIPAFNEERRLPSSLRQLRAFAVTRPFIRQVLVVDDGSSDATAQVVTEAAVTWDTLRLLRLDRHRGKGAAVRAGVLRCQGVDAIGFTDADLSADLRLLDDLIAALDRSDIAIASRELPGADLVVHEPLPREAIGKAYAMVVRATTLRGVPDAHCGLKCYRMSAAQQLFGRSRLDGVLFDLEILVLAAQRGMILAQFPARWSHHSGSRLGLGPSFAIGVIRDLILIKARHRAWLPLRAVTSGAER